jgi:hypothetical protein
VRKANSITLHDCITKQHLWDRWDKLQSAVSEIIITIGKTLQE